MKTKKIKLFAFAELSENAQEKAMERYKDKNNYYFYFDESLKSIEYFAENILHSKIKNYSISPYAHSYIQFDESFLSDEIMELKGLRAYKWIYNNIISKCYKGRYFSTNGYYDNNKKYQYKFRHSKIMKNLDDCNFTGTFSDCYITDVLLELLGNKIDCNLTVDGFVRDIFDNWLEKTITDMEYEDSEEFAKSQLDDGEEIYLENGSILNIN